MVDRERVVASLADAVVDGPGGRRVQAEPYLCINLGTGTIQEAALYGQSLPAIRLV